MCSLVAQWSTSTTQFNTVDGSEIPSNHRLDGAKTLQIMGYSPYQLMQDLFHQQYQGNNGRTVVLCFLGTYLVFQRSIGFNFLHLDSKFHAGFFGDSNPFFWKNCRSSCIFVLQYLFVCSMICDMCVSGTWHLNLGCLQF